MDEEEKHKLVSNMISFYNVFQTEVLDLLPIHNNSDLPLLPYKMLHEIYHDSTILPSCLSKRLSISTPNTSRNLKKLAELGYIVKTKDYDDKRITHINLTTKGIHLVETSLNNSNTMLFRKLDSLTRDEIGQLSFAFVNIKNLLIKMRT